MRNGLRQGARFCLFAGICLGVLATSPRALGSRADWPIRMTVEVSWNRPELPALPASAGPADDEQWLMSLELTDGRLVEVAAVEGNEPPRSLGEDNGSCRLGKAARGKVRARLEAPLSAVLIIRDGARATAFPLIRLLEAPQQTLQGAPSQIKVSRLAWDPIELDLGSGDGLTAPGSVVPVTVGLNVLTPEPSEALVRLVGELRPLKDNGEPVAWTCDQTQVVSTDAVRSPVVVLSVLMPDEPGTYVLTLQATWEPIVALEGSRIGRLIRRKRTTWPGPTMASRRTTLVVLDPDNGPSQAATPATEGEILPPTLVDSAHMNDLGMRPRLTASGRSPAPATPGAGWRVPEAALVDPAFRDRLRGWIWGSAEVGTLGPVDETGVAWSAIGLKTVNPGRPHRLRLTLAEGELSQLGVAVIDPGAIGQPGRIVLDAQAVPAPAPAEGAGGKSCSWVIWPGTTGPVVLLVNRGEGAAVKVASIELEELDSRLPAASLVGTASGESRQLGLVLGKREQLDPFDAPGLGGLSDPLARAGNLASYLEHCGLSMVVLPHGLADRQGRRLLEGQAAEDSTGPDQLELTLRLLAERKLQAWIEMPCESALPGLPAPDDPAAVKRGLVRLDGEGRPDGGSYWPLNPEVLEALKRRLTQTLEPRQRHENLAGVLIRLGPGPTLLGSPDKGLDDATYARFLAEMFDPEQARAVPGQGGDDAGRFAVRRQFLSGPGTTPWLLWRARQLGSVYEQLAAEALKAAPGAVLAVATPVLDEGPAGREARRIDLTNQPPQSAWKSVGLDLETWPREASNLVLLRGSGGVSEPLARDLATHPELDSPVASWPRRGLAQFPASWPAEGEADAGSLLVRNAVSRDPAPGDEPLGHAVAVLDAQWVLLPISSARGREATIARFARVIRALPAAAAAKTTALSAESGAAVRTWVVDGTTYLGLANDTPYTLRIDSVLSSASGDEAAVDDLGRGWRLAPEPVRNNGRRLVLDLPPFGVSAVRVAGADVTVESAVPYPMDDLDAQFRRLVALRDRLAQDALPGGIVNGGFEAVESRAGVLAQLPSGERPGSQPEGWVVLGGEAGQITLDAVRPHGGSSSLRFDSRKQPASVASQSFLPPTGQDWLVQAWLKAEPDQAKVRVWVEGESDGRTIAQVATMAVPSEWAERKIRVTNLPAGGLERARLRFEPLTGDRVWIDDLMVTGPGGFDPQRRAQLVLTMALQAHREKRYADFARLANSHWVRGPASSLPVVPGAAGPAGRVEATAESTPAARGLAPSTNPGAVRAGEANDLPAERRLR